MTEKLEQLIRQAISSSASQDSAARVAIYRAAKESMTRRTESLPADAQDKLRKQLADVIFRIENEIAQRGPAVHSAENPANNSTPFDFSETAVTDGLFDNSQPEKRSMFQIAADSLRIPNTKSGLAIGALLLAIALGAAVYSAIPDGPDETAQQATQAPAIEAVQPVDGAIPVVFNADFSDGITEFVPLSPTDAEKITVDTQSGVFRAEGQVILQSKEFIPVSHDKSYVMRVTFKTKAETLGRKPGLFAGFATYDSEKNLETAAPGTHRYFVVANNVAEGKQPDRDGWYSFSGVITGSGPTPFSFRDTTHYARALIILNYKMPEGISEIGEIEVMKLEDTIS